MMSVLNLLITATVGAVVGLGSVWIALTDPRLAFGTEIGPWQVASQARDPYTAARAARGRTLTLGAAEGVTFVARSDQGGNPLDPRCHYVVEGPVPAGELWTFVVTDAVGRLPVNPAGRIGFTSQDVIRRADNTVEIVVGATARPGNFVPSGGLSSLVLSLRVYSSRLAADLPEPAEMPQVRLLSCRGGRG
jgi:hypothetical protein